MLFICGLVLQLQWLFNSIITWSAISWFTPAGHFSAHHQLLLIHSFTNQTSEQVCNFAPTSNPEQLVYDPTCIPTSLETHHFVNLILSFNPLTYSLKLFSPLGFYHNLISSYRQSLLFNLRIHLEGCASGIMLQLVLSRFPVEWFLFHIWKPWFSHVFPRYIIDREIDEKNTCALKLLLMNSFTLPFEIEPSLFFESHKKTKYKERNINPVFCFFLGGSDIKSNISPKLACLQSKPDGIHFWTVKVVNMRTKWWFCEHTHIKKLCIQS